jgi:isocitrate dehydrogenase (NAD+)
MTLRVTLIQGGGIGLDQVPAVKRILEAAGVRIEWEEYLAGLAAVEAGQGLLSAKLIDSVRRNGLALKTKLLAAPEKHVNYNVEFRRTLGVFASVRPLRNVRGLPARFQNVDMVVIRELTEDLYAAIEHEVVPGVVQSIKIVTEAACRRFFRFAFDWARANGRKQIAAVHKANILKRADGLFLQVFQATAKDFPEIATRELIVDNCCMQLVSKPTQFDVLAMGNLYGDIVSDLGAGLVGGVSATAGINVGEGVRVYETFHGGSREQVGVDRANPLPLLLPATDLLRDVGLTEQAQRIWGAAEAVLTEGRVRTPDLGGAATTTQMADAIIARLG